MFQFFQRLFWKVIKFFFSFLHIYQFVKSNKQEKSEKSNSISSKKLKVSLNKSTNQKGKKIKNLKQTDILLETNMKKNFEIDLTNIDESKNEIISSCFTNEKLNSKKIIKKSSDIKINEKSSIISEIKKNQKQFKPFKLTQSSSFYGLKSKNAIEPLSKIRLKIPNGSKILKNEIKYQKGKKSQKLLTVGGTEKERKNNCRKSNEDGKRSRKGQVFEKIINNKGESLEYEDAIEFLRRSKKNDEKIEFNFSFTKARRYSTIESNVLTKCKKEKKKKKEKIEEAVKRKKSISPIKKINKCKLERKESKDDLELLKAMIKSRYRNRINRCKSAHYKRPPLPQTIIRKSNVQIYTGNSSLTPKSPVEVITFAFPSYPSELCAKGVKVGISECKGLKSSMEDFSCVKVGDDHSFFGVFDGHGGEKAAKYCSEKFIELIDKKAIKTNLDKKKIILNMFVDPGDIGKKNEDELIELIMRDTFKQIHQEILEDQKKQSSSYRWGMKYGGSCVSLVYIRKKGDKFRVYAGNVGDSKVILVRENDQIEVLTENHNAMNPKEIENVEKRGGRVMNGRVNGITTITRSLGDSFPFINPDPHIKTITIDNKKDKYIVMGSDGLWMYLNNEKIVEVINTEFKNDERDPRRLAQVLRDHAYNGGGKDNISVIVVLFD